MELQIAMSLLLSDFHVFEFWFWFLNWQNWWWIDLHQSLAVIEYCWKHVVRLMKSRAKVYLQGDKAQSAYNQRSGTALTFSWFKMSEVFPGILILHVVGAKSTCLVTQTIFYTETISSPTLLLCIVYGISLTPKGNQYCPLKHHPCYCIMINSGYTVRMYVSITEMFWNLKKKDVWRIGISFLAWKPSVALQALLVLVINGPWKTPLC